MNLAIRYVVASCLALLMSIGIFFMMQALISMNSVAQINLAPHKIANILMPKRELELIQIKHKPHYPDNPEQAPPEPIPITMSVPLLGLSGFNAPSLALHPNIKIGGIGFGIDDGEYLPIVKVAPIYPRRALSRGIEGHVIVEFTVTKTGSVTNVLVIEGLTSSGNPTKLFDTAAIKAVTKFKYKPKMIDGYFVDVVGVKNKITFKLIK